MYQPARLVSNSRCNSRMAMTQSINRYAADKIEVSLAVDIGKVTTLAGNKDYRQATIRLHHVSGFQFRYLFTLQSPHPLP